MPSHNPAKQALAFLMLVSLQGQNHQFKNPNLTFPNKKKPAKQQNHKKMVIQL
jgi:hypothetical protein